MKTYLKCLAAYLTGWVIAQSIFNRVMKHVRDREWDNEKDDMAKRCAKEVIYLLSEIEHHPDPPPAPVAEDEV